MLRRLRGEEVSQAALAKECGISQGYVGMIERGEKKPSVDKLIAICHFLRRQWPTSHAPDLLAPASVVDEGRSVYFEYRLPRRTISTDRHHVWLDLLPDPIPPWVSPDRYQRLQPELQRRQRERTAATRMTPEETALKFGIIIDAIVRYPSILDTYYPLIQRDVEAADEELHSRAELEDTWANGDL